VVRRRRRLVPAPRRSPCRYHGGRSSTPTATISHSPKPPIPRWRA